MVLLDDKFGGQKRGHTKGTGYFCNFDWITVHKPYISQCNKDTRKKHQEQHCKVYRGVCSQQLGLFQKTEVSGIKYLFSGKLSTCLSTKGHSRNPAERSR